MSVDQIIKLVYRKDYEGLRRLLAQGADLNATDEDGRTPLMHAVLASDAQAEMVDFLIGNGANPNLADKGQKWTALHFAARDQKLPVVGALLQHGVIVDAEDIFGNTPLWRCVTGANPKPDLVRLLIDEGANPQRKNRHGASPMDMAERTGKADLLRIMAS